MSLVSTYYDSLIARLVALLPPESGWTRIPNAYVVEENADVFLRQGWAVAVGRARNVQAMTCNQIVERTVRVVICREAMLTDSDAAAFDVIVKQLMEDINTVMADFEKNQTLNTGVGFAGYVGDNGIQSFRDEEGKPAFLSMDAEFTLRFVQAL
jgi:hypothetical protein